MGTVVRPTTRGARSMSLAPVDRRRFVAGTATALLALIYPRSASSIQASRAAQGPAVRAQLAAHLPPAAVAAAACSSFAEVPGLGLGVVEGGRVWTRGFGRARARAHAPRSPPTRCSRPSRSASPCSPTRCSGWSTRGCIDLDRPLYDYLPIPDANNPRMRQVTPRHVLSHTSGLPNWRDAPGPLLPATEPGTAIQLLGRGLLLPPTGGREGDRCADRAVHAGPDPRAAGHATEQLRLAGRVRSPEGRRAGRAGQRSGCVRGHRSNARTASPQKWGKAMIDWTYEDAARAVPLINPAVAGGAVVHDPQRRRVVSHHGARLLPVPRAPRGAPAGVAAGARAGHVRGDGHAQDRAERARCSGVSGGGFSATSTGRCCGTGAPTTASATSSSRTTIRGPRRRRVHEQPEWTEGLRARDLRDHGTRPSCFPLFIRRCWWVRR